MTKKHLKFISILSLFAILLLFGTVGISASEATCSSLSTSAFGFGKRSEVSSLTSDDLNASADLKDLKLYVGGMPFGVKFLTDGVMVVGFSDTARNVHNPAKAAGLRYGDIILSVNGQNVTSASELNSLIA